METVQAEQDEEPKEDAEGELVEVARRYGLGLDELVQVIRQVS